MENLGIRMFEIYKNKSVFITGNTGFKGSWLATFLQKCNAQITGYALPPDKQPNHFDLLFLPYKTTFANILDRQKLRESVDEAQPEIIFHLAAQALVKQSYIDPVNTYQTNVIGTLNVLEAARKCPSVKAVVLITTDKVYENKEWERPYKETDELGGYDMYSSSKACCEILIKSYRNSFFNVNDYGIKHNVLMASARAGNVIAGGDWSRDRLLPDIAIATSKDEKVLIRNPKSVRPWQHVLDCISGYLLLGKKLLESKKEFADAWNFSPNRNEIKNVYDVTVTAKKAWNKIDVEFGMETDAYHEAGLLILDNSKAVERLHWKPVWTTDEAIEKTIEWYKKYYKDYKVLTEENINDYLKDASYF